MSRTDVHRPWRVQAADPHNRHRLKWIPENSRGFPWLEFWPLYNTCGCPICSGATWRKVERRRVRHGQRKHIEEEIKLG